MFTFSQLGALLESHISQIELKKEPLELYQPINYILEDGGKRMRPILMLLACDAYGKDVTKCIDIAFGIEVFHNFTLLHDDIMDKAPIRRGRDTVHVKWNENIAILSGDAMVILAYTQFTKGIKCTDEGTLQDILKIFNKSAIEVCEGQQLDMNFEQSSDVDINQYINMIRLKTSVLLAASLEIGALIGGATNDQQKAMYEFGINLGLAFQIQDDILDTYGDGETFGKNIGGDIAVGKKTFLLLSALNVADPNQREILLHSRDYTTIKSIYNSLKIQSIASQSVQQYYDIAMKWLDKAGGLAQTSELKSYAESLLNRNK